MSTAARLQLLQAKYEDFCDMHLDLDMSRGKPGPDQLDLTLGLLDCGIKPVEPLVEGTKMIADGLHLTQQVIPATTQYLADLLTGPGPPERFITLKKGHSIGDEDMTLPEE